MRDLSRLADQLSNLTVGEAAKLADLLRARWEQPRKARAGLTFNEGKVCDAIVRRFEEREQRTREALRWPEKENHKSPVELAWRLPARLSLLTYHLTGERAADPRHGLRRIRSAIYEIHFDL
jgi:hypothetical protein